LPNTSFIACGNYIAFCCWFFEDVAPRGSQRRQTVVFDNHLLAHFNLPNACLQPFQTTWLTHGHQSIISLHMIWGLHFTLLQVYCWPLCLCFIWCLDLFLAFSFGFVMLTLIRNCVWLKELHLVLQFSISWSLHSSVGLLEI